MFLPLAVSQGWRFDPQSPAVWQTLLLFAGGVGLPFAVLSANAPLIQAWCCQSGGPSAEDPYFLYGASNLGSLIALMAFPLVAEPLFGATTIGRGWAIGFLILGVALLASGMLALRVGTRPAPTRPPAPAADTPAPALTQIGLWALLAFVPSSLMLAVTTKISTDIGSMPLIWVIPLALYLLSFVLVFTNRPLIANSTLRLLFVASLGVLAVIFGNLFGAHLSLLGAVGLILAFLPVALFAHSKLYRLRPAPQHLTVFYVTMSVGGALGGLFNSVLAPLIFNELYEGAITITIAGLLAISRADAMTARQARPGIFAAVLVAVVLLTKDQITAVLNDDAFTVGVLVMITGLALALRRYPVSVTFLVVATVAVGTATIHKPAHLRDRSFFGTHKVLDQGQLRLYANGTTVHGAQHLGEFGPERPAPRSYYHRNGPMAQVLTSPAGQKARTVGIVGLGVGALACYRQPGQNWHFFEIDVIVNRIARDPNLFTYMSRCAGDAPTHLGDARMVLARQEGVGFDILVIDAYSSDAVPVHLTTREAIELYLDRLQPGGILVFHISNRYYAIDRPLGRAAANLGLAALWQNYPGQTSRDPGDGASVVAIMARESADLSRFTGDARWQPLGSDGGRVWTDDYTNLLQVLKLNRGKGGG